MTGPELPCTPVLHITCEMVTAHPADVLSERYLEGSLNLNRNCSRGSDTDTDS
jgi:hypothetical protein